MKFTPKTEEQIATENLIPEGTYSFEVKQAMEETSKSGNPMIHLLLHVFVDDSIRQLDDYLLEKMAFKLRHFCASTDLLDLYQQGALTASDCEGKTGWVKIAVQPDKSGKYPPRNSAKDYSSSPEMESVQPTASRQGLIHNEGGSGEDVPF